MADARLEVELGPLKFVGEGSEKWVEHQWDRVVQHSSTLASAPQKEQKAQTLHTIASVKQAGSLATFLKEKAVGASQVKRFLATAVWLMRSGAKSVKTVDVSNALIEAQQKKLGNPADVLNQNVSKGFCVKQGDGFYVTPEGEDSFN